MVVRPLRSFLITESWQERRPWAQRRQLKDALQLLNEETERGLARKPTLRLDWDAVSEYEEILAVMQRLWRSTDKMSYSARMRTRLENLHARGWRGDSDTIAKLLGGREPGMCNPREVATLLLCMSRDIDLHHPQTISTEIARIRTAQRSLEPASRRKPRRGRPPKGRRI